MKEGEGEARCKCLCKIVTELHIAMHAQMQDTRVDTHLANSCNNLLHRHSVAVGPATHEGKRGWKWQQVGPGKVEEGRRSAEKRARGRVIR